MQKITLTIKEIYSKGNYEHTAKATYCTIYDNLFLRIWNFFKTFKRNSVIKSMSIHIELKKYSMSCIFERFIAYEIICFLLNKKEYKEVATVEGIIEDISNVKDYIHDILHEIESIGLQCQKIGGKK